MRPGLNLMKGKAPPKQRGKGKAKAIDDASRSAIEKKRKNRLIHGKASDQPHRGKVKNRRQQRCSDARASTRPREGRNFGRATRVGILNRREETRKCRCCSIFRSSCGWPRCKLRRTRCPFPSGSRP